MYTPVSDGTVGSAAGTSQITRIRRLRACDKKLTTTSKRSSATTRRPWRAPVEQMVDGGDVDDTS